MRTPTRRQLASVGNLPPQPSREEQQKAEAGAASVARRARWCQKKKDELKALKAAALEANELETALLSKLATAEKKNVLLLRAAKKSEKALEEKQKTDATDGSKVRCASY
eukprot:4170299-Pleurochrysis_carterae.AAC.1